MKVILKWLGAIGAIILGAWTFVRWYSERETSQIEEAVIRG